MIPAIPSRAHRWLGGAIGLVHGAGVLAAVVVGFQPTVVVSDSMEPAIRSGALVLTYPVDARRLEPGDVVVREDGPTAVVHRVVHIGASSGTGVTVWTKGDANGDPDRTGLVLDGEVRRVVAVLPAIGGAIEAAGASSVRGGLLGFAALAALGAVATARPPRPPRPASMPRS